MKETKKTAEAVKKAAEKKSAKKPEKAASKTAKKPAVKKPAAKKVPTKKAEPKKSDEEIAFGKAVEKLGKLKFANREELFKLFKAGITRGKLLAKKAK